MKSQSGEPGKLTVSGTAKTKRNAGDNTGKCGIKDIYEFVSTLSYYSNNKVDDISIVWFVTVAIMLQKDVSK